MYNLDKVHGDEHLGSDETEADVQERVNAFWEPEDKAEAASYLAVELMDETELQDLFFAMCANDAKDDAAILAAAKKMIIHAQHLIYVQAQNDRLPITTK